RCVLTDAAGNQLITDEVTIILPDPLVKITNTPENQHVVKNTVISFNVELDSTEGVTYQWQREKSPGRWFNVMNTGYNTDTVTMTASPYAPYPYRCEITDANGTKIYTGSYTVSFYEPPINPRIIKNPSDAYVYNYGVATFNVQAEGSSFVDDGSEDTGVTYQWWRKKTPTSSWVKCTTADATTATLAVKVYANMGDYQYMCEVKDGYGNTLKTKEVMHHIVTPVTIAAQPTAILENGTATFTFTATGDVKTYQWQCLKNGTWMNVSGSSYQGNTTATLTTAVKRSYRCKITDLAGTVTYTDEIAFPTK
ncbi:MAG: hypothetical protein IKJ94_02375, partial [Oscillospiraceae bacterium]|nr:hypothetical protein [Oscillospiraceae bacterium]